jgi:uncharacterized protein (DUF427 family)
MTAQDTNPEDSSREPQGRRESVWDYPRPPRLEETGRSILVVFNGVEIVSAPRAWRVLETSHPPTYYLPPEFVRMEHLEPSRRRSFCEWKGQASYYDVVAGARRAPSAAWTYYRPTAAFAPLAGAVAFYAQLMDACFVDGERVSTQEGDFYGGWITSDLVGPFKGAPGTRGW